jgi:hypothetical protein
MASGVAPRRRTEMDFGHDQRFGTTLGLSVGSDWREGPLVRAAFVLAAITLRKNCEIPRPMTFA